MIQMVHRWLKRILASLQRWFKLRQNKRRHLRKYRNWHTLQQSREAQPQSKEAVQPSSTSEQLQLEPPLTASSVEVNQNSTGDRNIIVGANSGTVTVTQHITEQKRWLGKNFQMPPLPDYFVARPKHQQALKSLLLANEKDTPGTLVVSAIYGLGGIGKSVLAAALAHDSEIQDRFADGILWSTLGQEPDILPVLYGWIQALGDRDYKPTSIDAASTHLRSLLYDKRVLLVVDDAWNPDHVAPFRVGGQGCRVLVTTREADVPDAQRYDVEEMTSEQSLSLLTQKYPDCVTEQDRQQAIALAQSVGHLPLALELAAAQLTDGMTFDELLEDLRAEVARLEVFDRPGAESSQKERKRLSLLASLNLSLQRLSPEQQRQFAWLGILPEDVLIAETVAAIIWDLTPKQARTVLRFFKSRALLLAGAQQPGQKRSYRLHDLMHDLAKRLLTSASMPQVNAALPGLGVQLAEAHSIFLNRYRAKTANELWHTLPPDGYIHSHLIWHLEQARQLDDIHQLLQEDSDAGQNGWYEACEAIGQTASFITDVARAWQLAEAMYDRHPSVAIGLQCRYALIIATLNNLASNLPPELIAALVVKKYWQPIQGLAYAQQIQNESSRADTLTALVPYLPESLLPRALEVACHIQDEYSRARALSALVPLLPELMPKALEATRYIQSTSSRASALSALVPFLPQLVTEALEVACHIQDEYSRARAFRDLVPLLPESLLPKTLKITRHIQDERSRAYILSALVPRLPQLVTEALEVTYHIQNEYSRAHILSNLVPHLPESLLPETLEIARHIHDEYSCVHALSTLMLRLPELKTETLEKTRNIQRKFSRACALINLVPHLPELAFEALEETRNIQPDFPRARALRDLVPHLPESLLPEALEITRHIHNESDRAHALGTLVPRLPESLLPEALGITRHIQDESDRVSAISILIPHLPELLLPEALEITHSIQNEYSRARALSTLVPYLPELASETLELIHNIQDDLDRADILTTLVQHLPKSLLSEVLEITRSIQNEPSRISVLSTLIPYLPKSLLSKAIEIARQFQDEWDHISALSGLVLHLPELADQILELIPHIQSEFERANALNALVPYLPELASKALDLTRNIQDETFRASALSTLVPYLPELASETLDLTRNIQSEFFRVRTLNNLAPHLPRSLLPEALEIIRNIQPESRQAEAFQGIASRLAELPVSFRLWTEALHSLSHLHRQELLPTLATLEACIISLGGKQALLEMLQAMRDVCRQWR